MRYQNGTVTADKRWPFVLPERPVLLTLKQELYRKLNISRSATSQKGVAKPDVGRNPDWQKANASSLSIQAIELPRLQ